jgi:hypothetical protein
MQQQAAQATSAYSRIRQQVRFGHVTICQEVRVDCTGGVRAAALHDLAAHNGCWPCIQRIIQVHSTVLVNTTIDGLNEEFNILEYHAGETCHTYLRRLSMSVYRQEILPTQLPHFTSGGSSVRLLPANRAAGACGADSQAGASAASPKALSAGHEHCKDQHLTRQHLSARV